MKKLVLLAAVLFGFVGCTKSQVNDAVCAAQDKVVQASSDAIVSALACGDAAAVKADVLALVSKANICKPADGTLKGPIADALCPGIVDGLVGAATKTIPAAWKCTGGKTADELKALLLPLCKSNISI